MQLGLPSSVKTTSITEANLLLWDLQWREAEGRGKTEQKHPNVGHRYLNSQDKHLFLNFVNYIYSVRQSKRSQFSRFLSYLLL